MPGHLKKGSITDVKSVRKRDLEQRSHFRQVLSPWEWSFSLRSKTMPRREILTSTERMQLLAFPDDEGELIRK